MIPYIIGFLGIVVFAFFLLVLAWGAWAVPEDVRGTGTYSDRWKGRYEH